MFLGTEAKGMGGRVLVGGQQAKMPVVQSLVRWVPKASLESSLASIPLVRGPWLALRKDSVASDTHRTFAMCQVPCYAMPMIPGITWLGHAPQ